VGKTELHAPNRKKRQHKDTIGEHGAEEEEEKGKKNACTTYSEKIRMERQRHFSD
jgi:hypothetical protein